MDRMRLNNYGKILNSNSDFNYQLRKPKAKYIFTYQNTKKNKV
jgi:hypothetical protein